MCSFHGRLQEGFFAQRRILIKFGRVPLPLDQPPTLVSIANIPFDESLIARRLVLDSILFIFNERIYR